MRKCLRMADLQTDQLLEGGDGWRGQSQMDDDPGIGSVPIRASRRISVPAPLHMSERVTACRNIRQWLSFWRVAAPYVGSLANISIMSLSLSLAGDKVTSPVVMRMRALMCERNSRMLVIHPGSKCFRGMSGWARIGLVMPAVSWCMLMVARMTVPMLLWRRR